MLFTLPDFAQRNSSQLLNAVIEECEAGMGNVSNLLSRTPVPDTHPDKCTAGSNPKVQY
jgi:hypothetical protein